MRAASGRISSRSTCSRSGADAGVLLRAKAIRGGGRPDTIAIQRGAGPMKCPPPAKAGGGWEGVATARADPKGTPPQTVRPAITAGVRSSPREPVARNPTPSHPAFDGVGAFAGTAPRQVNGRPTVQAPAAGRARGPPRTLTETSP